MKPKQVFNQMSNVACVNLYTMQFVALAKNVFKFNNMPKSVNLRYLNSKLVRQGAVAFFQDEVMGLLALPFNIMGKLDLYNEPIDIQVYGANGYVRTLKKGEYVIMYDNNTYQPIFNQIIQYSQRVANCMKTIDINISQQKTPRIWQIPHEQLQSFKQMMNEIDTFEEAVSTYQNLQTQESNSILAPAPYVADKIEISKEKIYNEFLRFIGIASLNVQKKERLIQDEVSSSQGGTIAFRFNRFQTRKEAIEEINEKFHTNISVEYYDGEPTMKKEQEVEEDVLFNDVPNDSNDSDNE